MVGTDKDKERISGNVTVTIPRALAMRVDEVWQIRGYVSRADYVRAAIQRQLEFNEVKL